mmetsp:Transcript_59776/g.140842  ORF Transcript_59776/g.140842 Transcript_59776/m.140842 type:complete len:233 (-) Transcript_59776:1161-1859(-)
MRSSMGGSDARCCSRHDGGATGTASSASISSTSSPDKVVARVTGTACIFSVSDRNVTSTAGSGACSGESHNTTGWSAFDPASSLRCPSTCPIASAPCPAARCGASDPSPSPSPRSPRSPVFPLAPSSPSSSSPPSSRNSPTSLRTKSSWKCPTSSIHMSVSHTCILSLRTHASHLLNAPSSSLHLRTIVFSHASAFSLSSSSSSCLSSTHTLVIPPSTERAAWYSGDSTALR